MSVTFTDDRCDARYFSHPQLTLRRAIQRSVYVTSLKAKLSTEKKSPRKVAANKRALVCLFARALCGYRIARARSQCKDRAMTRPLDQPFFFFILALVLMLLAAYAGRYVRERRGPMNRDEREELNLVLTSSLTLLALIIGFSFSMAVGRYDDRKRDEATEANTIETAYLRADFLPAADATRVRELLRRYTGERIATYAAGTESIIEEHRSASTTIQSEMWAIVERAVSARQSGVMALVASSMSDVVDSQRYAAAAWNNRIPTEAWVLMFAIALCCCSLIGYDTRLRMGIVAGHFVLPVLIAVSFFLIADLDSTHQGLIRVSPDNLILTAQSIKG